MYVFMYMYTYYVYIPGGEVVANYRGGEGRWSPTIEATVASIYVCYMHGPGRWRRLLLYIHLYTHIYIHANSYIHKYIYMPYLRTCASATHFESRAEEKSYVELM